MFLFLYFKAFIHITDVCHPPSVPSLSSANLTQDRCLGNNVSSPLPPKITLPDTIIYMNESINILASKLIDIHLIFTTLYQTVGLNHESAFL